MSSGLQQLCAAADRLRELANRKQALMAEVERTNEADRAAGLAALNEIDCLNARLRKTRPQQHWVVKQQLAAAQRRWQAIEDGRARRVARMDVLLDQAREIEREIDALADSEPSTPRQSEKKS